jgi:hypothetical protein
MAHRGKLNSVSNALQKIGVKLRKRLGDDFPLAKVKERLRCERCSSRQIVITFLAPNQRTGNVAFLFRRTPEQ